MARGANCCLVSSCRISHFGPKPAKGGSPARESMTKGARAVRAGNLDDAVASMLIEVVLLRLNKLKMAKVMITYIARVSMVRWGEY